MRLDQREFQETLRQYLVASKRKLSEILNKKLLYIASAAMKYTPKADRAKIENELGVVGYRVSISKKTGKFARRQTLVRQKLAARIINGRRVKAGENSLSGSALEQEIRKFINRRLRAIGSLKAGWVGVVKDILKRVKEVANIEKTPSVKQRGFATPATEGWNPTAELKYRVLVKKEGERTIDPRVVEALSSAFRRETASMQDYIERKMQEDADRINAK